MSMRRFLLAFGLLTLSLVALAQPETSRRPWNVGVNLGVGGMNQAFFPSAELLHKGTALRVSPGIGTFSIGVSQEVYALRPSNDLQVIVSGYYSRTQVTDEWLGADVSGLGVNDTFWGVFVMGGVKAYFGQHGFSYMQLGLHYLDYSKENRLPSNTTALRPALEFGIGLHLWKNFPHQTVKQSGHN